MQVELQLTLKVDISQISEIPKELYDKIVEADTDDIDFSHDLYHELESVVDLTQGFSIDEFSGVSIKEFKES